MFFFFFCRGYRASEIGRDSHHTYPEYVHGSILKGYQPTRIDQREFETVPDDPDQEPYCRGCTLPRICLEYGERTQHAERMQMQDSNK